jgi:Cu+-exporting ATPase
VSFWTQHAKKRNISLIIHNVDPIITAEKIASLFDMPQDMLKILPSRMQTLYHAETSPVKEMSTSAACTNEFSNIMRLVTCAKIVRNAATAGLFVQAVSILIGLVLVVMESLLHIGVTPSWMIIFECAVSLITILCVNIRRMY